jgi:hypothetical protein
MQVLEVANNVDVQSTLETIDNYDSFINGNIFIRLFTAIRKVFA